MMYLNDPSIKAQNILGHAVYLQQTHNLSIYISHVINFIIREDMY
jgi:hypothetical protein